MTDVILRELERRWKETGLVEDEAALLQARLRVGGQEGRAPLTARVDIAACLGHAAARQVSNTPAPPEQILFEELLPALYESVPAEAQELAKLASLRSAYHLLTFKLMSPGSLEQPHADLVRGRELVRRYLVRPRMMMLSPISEMLRESEGVLLHADLVDDDLDDLSYLLDACLGDIRATVLDPLLRLTIVHDLVRLQSVADPLVPWLLGYSDPLKTP